MKRADVLVCTPEKWDLITRGWRDSSRSFVKDVSLLIIDEIHLLGEDRGAVLEAIVSRTRYISDFVKSSSAEKTAGLTDTRIVGLSTALANPRDLAEWMGIDFEPPSRGLGMYNFRPSVRPIPMTVHIQGFPGRAYCPRMATMNKPCYAAIREHSPKKPVIIFVASRRQTRLTAMDLISYAAGDDDPRMFLNDDMEDSSVADSVEGISDAALKHTLSFGIGLHHAGLSSGDRETVERLFLDNEIQVRILRTNTHIELKTHTARRFSLAGDRRDVHPRVGREPSGPPRHRQGHRVLRRQDDAVRPSQASAKESWSCPTSPSQQSAAAAHQPPPSPARAGRAGERSNNLLF
jgi:activating signal cointegrator complex subunit 3